ncbi:DEAD/DEAH box helicase family protein [Amycolatopsis sp. NPDC003861]
MTDTAKPDFEQNLVDFGSAKFRELRPGQRQVLTAYADQHLDTADLTIEMPTGEGKTLLALLIADHALTRGWSVAYLTGTRQLAERAEREADDLGIEVVRFAAQDYGGAKLDDYHQARAVGIMNYWVYFSSRPRVGAADLVIFDDAHLAEQPLSGLQTLRIPDKAGPARHLYQTICELVVAHTNAYPGLRAMLDGTARPGTPPELLSFSDWDAIEGPTRDAIEASPLVTDRTLEDQMVYVWPTVRDHLTQSGALIGLSQDEQAALGGDIPTLCRVVGVRGDQRGLERRPDLRERLLVSARTDALRLPGPPPDENGPAADQPADETVQQLEEKVDTAVLRRAIGAIGDLATDPDSVGQPSTQTDLTRLRALAAELEQSGPSAVVAAREVQSLQVAFVQPAIRLADSDLLKVWWHFRNLATRLRTGFGLALPDPPQAPSPNTLRRYLISCRRTIAANATEPPPRLVKMHYQGYPACSGPS